jgi:hypothetical protein
MPKLAELKKAIDEGQTAKLRRYQSVLHWYVKKKGAFYIKHAEGYKNPDGVLIVRPSTALYETWEGLLGELGYHASVNSWLLTSEPLRDYTPPPEWTEPDEP